MTPPEQRGGEGLKPCPFDGSSPHRGPTKTTKGQDGETFQRYRIWCPHGCAEQNAMTEDLAIAAWNRRPSSPPSGGGGWPSREAVEEAIYKAFGLGQENDAAEDAVSRVLALFPPVVGWRGIETHDNSADEVLVMADGWKKPIVAWRHHPSSRTDMWLSVPGRYQVRPTHFAALPAAPDHIGETDEMVRDQTDGVG